ncbi:hypothetical protein [Leptothoe spongobia]|uniref:Uncharacterized protein n=1 Tax=Leptothoe spongobia TAU-MAC 1115 TaxID=1967444 RepID=A0A947DG32_9CYAN|nr:hypothetical protein [Leptothoe spongobia]MBT9316280.1 hypothetical protein [Leptothoe spongobia TAU-MAC 1115]
MSSLIEQRLEEIHGLDLAFDAATNGPQDVLFLETDFEYATGLNALVQEIYRIFLTPLGSLVDDPGYGIDLSMIGQANDPRITIGLTRVAFLNALQHSSFQNRFTVAQLDVEYSQNQPNALSVTGRLEVNGFEELLTFQQLVSSN